VRTFKEVFSLMTREEKLEYLKLLEEKERRRKYRKIFSYYPDEGPLRRELYVKHNQFFEAGPRYRERLALAANRVGKSEGMGGYEATLHLTGDYPFWWKGRRFTKPVDAWAAGDTSLTVRDIIQFKLWGPFTDGGSGLIPKDKIHDRTLKRGLSDAIDTIYVKHKSGGISQLTLKSYDQRRESFQGTEKDFIWLDEEPPLEIYTECLLRTMTNNGMLMLTFTPLMGLSETVMAFLPGGQLKENQEGSKFVVMATWDDAPHLSQEVKDELWNSIPPFQRDARSKGVPQLGSGAIYPVPESDFAIDPFDIPAHWKKSYAMDVGWNRTAALWGAYDQENDCLYLYAEHYRGQAEPSIHVEAIKAKGAWIPGVIDPASRGRNQKDGGQLMQDYIDLGLDLDTAFNGVESGIYEVWQRLSTGRLKVFKSLSNFFYEFRLYRRDENGRIVKANDHLMDTMRYLVMSGIERAKTKPVEKKKFVAYSGHGSGWMG
jgi:phage terminase large subunit-like protein